MLGVGSASILSRALGKGDKETVDKIMGELDLLGAEGEIKELGVRYLRVLFLGSIFVNFTQSANLRSSILDGGFEMNIFQAAISFFIPEHSMLI